MAIAFDNATSYNGGTGTFSHTTSSSPGAYMFVLTSGSTTAVSYNGVSLTLTTSYSWTFGTLKVWTLAGPSSGANDISITSGVNTNVVAATYTGLGTTQPEASANNNISYYTTSITSSVTTLTDNAWVLGFCVYVTSSYNQNAGSGATKRISIAGSPAGDTPSLGIYDSNGVVTPAGSYSMTMDASSGTGPWATVMYSVIAPTTNGGAPLLMNLIM